MTPPLVSCTARIAITTANAVITPTKSASWAETNISAMPGADREDELADGDRDPERELAPWRAEPPAARPRDVRERERRGTDRGQQRERQQPVAQPVDRRDRAGGEQRGAEPEQRRAPRAHGWNR